MRMRSELERYIQLHEVHHYHEFLDGVVFYCVYAFWVVVLMLLGRSLARVFSSYGPYGI